MPDMNPIASTKIAAGSNAGAQPQALQGSSSGVFASGAAGANFWDMIVSQFGASNAKAATLTQPEQNSTVTNKLATNVKAENPLAALQVALATQIDAQGNVVLANADASAEKLQGQLDLTNQIINHLKNVLPESAENEGIFSKLLSKLQAKSDNLQASLSVLEGGMIAKDTPVEDIPLPLMIALGLNPAEISEVTEKIDALEKKLGREITVEDLIAGVGGIIAPAPETATLALASAKAKEASTGQLGTIDENTEPTDDLAAQLNAMDVGGEETAAKPNSKELTPLQKMEERLEKSGEQTIDAKPSDKTTDAAPKKDITAFKENLVNLLNGNKAQHGDMTFPVSFFNGDIDANLYQSYGLPASSSVPFGQSSQAANIIASSATAGQAHPAAQIVAATLAKAGKDGSENIMTVRLDPPELGNVSVRLQFGKDKMVKAIVTAEKPETYMMLQRDSQALERALHSAGLETNAESISFQLAQDNGAFAHDNNGKGSDNNFGGGSADAQNADNVEIVQSSVTWRVDPNTGHVRYNIFA